MRGGNEVGIFLEPMEPWVLEEFMDRVLTVLGCISEVFIVGIPFNDS